MGEFDGFRLKDEPAGAEDQYEAPGTVLRDNSEFGGQVEVIDRYDPAKANVDAVKNQNLGAEEEANAYKNSKKSGHPVNITRAQPKAFDEDFDGWETAAPEIKNHVAKSPNNTAISRGDFENLGVLDRVIKGVPQHYTAGRLNNEIADLRWQEMIGNGSPEITTSINDLKALRGQLPEGQGFVERGIFGVAEQANLLMRTIGAGAAGGAAGAAAGAGTAALLNLSPLAAVPEEPITVPYFVGKGYAIGSRAGSAQEIFKLEAAGAYDEFLDIRDLNGQPIDPKVIKMAAYAVGGINAGLEMIGLGAILKTVPGGSKILGRLTKAQIGKLVARKSVQASLLALSKKFAGAVGTETLTEVAQEAVNILAGEIIKDVSETREGTFFRPFSRGEAGDRLIEIAKRTIETTTILAGAPTSISMGATIVTGEQSERWITKQTQINEAVNGTLTKERAPDKVEDILNEYGQETEVYITDDGINTLYQSNPEAAQAILKKLNVDADAAVRDAGLGLETPVILSKLQAQLTPEEFALIKGDIKQNALSFSENQLKSGAVSQELDRLGTLFAQELDEEDNFTDQKDRIKKEVLAAGFNEEETDTYLNLVSGLANRLNQDGKPRTELLEQLTFKPMKFKEFKKIFGVKPDPKNLLLQSAFHGTPFRFDKFSLDHLGKGEGAQAFGWGLYFAEKKDIADWYRSNLTGKQPRGRDTFFKGQNTRDIKNPRLRIRLNDIAFQMITFPGRSFESIKEAKINDLEELIVEEKALIKEDSARTDKFLKQLNEAKIDIEASTKDDYKRKPLAKGATLKVELPGDDQILDWEKPLSEQSEEVQKAIDFIAPDKAAIEKNLRGNVLKVSSDVLSLDEIEKGTYIARFYNNKGDLSNDIIEQYNKLLNDEKNSLRKTLEVAKKLAFNSGALQTELRINSLEKSLADAGVKRSTRQETGQEFYQTLANELGSEKAASEWLSEHGVKGHKFWDGDSRNRAGDKTFNYVVYDDQVIDIVETFFQAQEGAPPKAGITTTKQKVGEVYQEKYLISLFEDRDFSSLVHETGHLFMREMTAIVESGTASDQMVKDLTAVRSWLGLAEGEEIKVEHQEKFAEGFELYFWEGKSPTDEMETVFARFKAYMRNLYETARDFNVTLNAEVRGVFDRIILANTETQTTARLAGITAMTKDQMNELGILDADQNFLRSLIAQALEKAEEALISARNKGLKERRREWRETARREIIKADQRGVYKAVDKIKADKKKRLNRQQFTRIYGNEQVETFPGIKLSESKKRTLRTIRAEVQEGEKGQRLAVRDKEGHILRHIVSPSTFPPYFQNKGYKKKKVLTAIDKALDGKGLGRVQIETLEDLNAGFREQLAGDIKEFRALPTEVSAEDLNVGDTYKINGEQFEVIEVRENGSVVVKDGQEITLGPDDTLNVDRGSLKIKSEAAPKERIEDFPEDVGLDELLFEEFEDITPSESNLPAKGLLVNDGRDLNEAALEYGFSDADEMIYAFFDTRPLDEVVNDEVEIKQREHDSQFKAEDFLAETKEYEDYLVIVGKYLNDLQEKQRVQESARGRVSLKSITRTAIKQQAKRVMDATLVKDAKRIDRYLSNMKRASDEMRRAIARGDWSSAIRANERMRLNYELSSLSSKVKKLEQSTIKKTRKAGKSKTINIRYREAIRQIGNKMKLSVLLPDEPQELVPIETLFMGGDVSEAIAVPDFLLVDKVDNYRQLTTAELQDLNDVISYLIKTGRDIFKGVLSDGVTLLKDVTEKAVAVMETIAPKKVKDRFSVFSTLSDWHQSFFAKLDGLPFIIKALGGYTSVGGKAVKSYLEQVIIDPLKDAKDTAVDMFDKSMGSLSPHTKQIGNSIHALRKKYKGHKIFIEDVNVPAILQNYGKQVGYFTPEQIFAIALNLGNEQNQESLMRGYADLSQESLSRILDVLSIEDMDAVQGVWNEMEKLYPETNAVHKRINNFAMKKVEARPFTFKGKSYQGGYYPLQYNRELSEKVASFEEVSDFFNGGDSQFSSPYAAKGHTMVRISGVALPVDLTTSVIPRHFSKAIQYIAYAEVVRDIDRITKDESFADAAIRALGRNVYREIRPALKHIANPRVPGLDIPGGRIASYMRGVATAWNLSLNVSVALKQPFSTFSAIHDMGLGESSGLKVYLKGLQAVLASPSVHYNSMIEMSKYMKDRSTSFDRDYRAEFTKMTGAQKELTFGDASFTWDKVVNWGYMPIRMSDMAAVLPIWWGSYYEKLNEGGTNEADAVRYADDIVRDTQPSAQALDLSAWFREGGFFGLFNLHQTFTVGKYGQRQRLYYRAWKGGHISTSDYAWFNFVDAFLPIISINIMVALMKGQDVEDEETARELLNKTIQSWIFMGVPLANSVIDSVTNIYRDPVDVPGERQIETVVDAMRGIKRGIEEGHFTKKEKSRIMWDIGHTISAAGRFPLTKVLQKVITAETAREAVFGKTPK